MVEVLASPVTWVGMDVHMSSISAAATIGATGELVQARLAGDAGQAVQWARALPGRVRVTYEAGPAGFGLARALGDAGIEVPVERDGERGAERALRSPAASGVRVARGPSL